MPHSLKDLSPTTSLSSRIVHSQRTEAPPRDFSATHLSLTKDHLMSLHPGLDTAADLYQKLRRDADRLEKLVTPDDFFNFVITAHSLCDWAERDPSLSSTAHAAVANVRVTSWMQICRDLANGSKHFEVTTYNASVTGSHGDVGYGTGRYGVGAYGVGEWSITVEHDGSTHDALAVVVEVMAVWHDFFQGYR